MQGARRKRGRPARIRPPLPEPLLTAGDGVDSSSEPMVTKRRRGRPAKGTPSGRRRLAALLLLKHTAVGVRPATRPSPVRAPQANIAVNGSTLVQVTPIHSSVKVAERRRTRAVLATEASLAQRPRGTCLGPLAGACASDATEPPMPNAGVLAVHLSLETPSCTQSEGILASHTLWGEFEGACALEPPSGGGGAARSQAVAGWLREWQLSLQAWWLVAPFRDGLQGCLGALGLHLAQRLQLWQRSAQDTTGPPPPLQTTQGCAIFPQQTPGPPPPARCRRCSVSFAPRPSAAFFLLIDSYHPRTIHNAFHEVSSR